MTRLPLRPRPDLNDAAEPTAPRFSFPVLAALFGFLALANVASVVAILLAAS